MHPQYTRFKRHSRLKSHKGGNKENRLNNRMWPMSPHKKMFSFVLLAEKNNGTNHKIDVNQRPTKAGDHHYQILGTCLQDIPLS